MDSDDAVGGSASRGARRASANSDDGLADRAEATSSTIGHSSSLSRRRAAHAALGREDDPDEEGDFVDADAGEDEDEEQDSLQQHARRALLRAGLDLDDDDDDDEGNEDDEELDDEDDIDGEDEDEEYYAAEIDLDDAFGEADDDEDEDVQQFISRITAGQGYNDDEDDDENAEQAEDVEMAGAGNAAGNTQAGTATGQGQQEIGLLDLLRSLTSGQRAGDTGLSISGMALRALREYAENSNVPLRIVSRTTANERETEEDEEIEDDDDDEDYIDEDDYDDEQPMQWLGGGQSSYRPRLSPRWEKVLEPVPAGQELMLSGEFGKTPMRPLSAPRSVYAPSRNLHGLLDARKTSTRPLPRSQLASYVPNTSGVEVASYEGPCYCGQYSEDSTFFYSCTQDHMVHMYDTTKSAPPRSSVKRYGFGQRQWSTSSQLTSLRPVKSIRAREVRWTITDANLSPDNRFIIYSSITPYVHLVPTGIGDDTDSGEDGAGGAGQSDEDMIDPDNPSHSARQVQLNFGAHSRRGVYDYGAVWSIRFSGDSREIVAGAGSGDIAVYDIEARRQTLRVSGHHEDVNAVAFADRGSGNVLISGSDDSYVKVWDRRSLHHGKPAGILVGHTEGVTYVSPKGDGRYCVSNGKDQCAKLWDLRQMHSGDDYGRLSRIDYGVDGFDYRNSHYPRPKHETRPDDCSLMTFRGHAVLRTLIRCHFSPAATTGQKYIYSGSADGFIHIWSLDGQVVQVLDRSKALPLVFDPAAGASAPSAPEFELSVDREGFTPEPELVPDGFEGRYRPLHGPTRASSICVRDVSWHSAEPSLMSTAWDGANRRRGSIAKHEWKDFGKRGLSLEDAVEKARLEALR